MGPAKTSNMHRDKTNTELVWGLFSLERVFTHVKARLRS